MALTIFKNMNNISSTAKMTQQNVQNPKNKAQRTETSLNNSSSDNNFGTLQAAYNAGKNLERDMLIASTAGAGVGAFISFIKQKDLLNKINTNKIVNKPFNIADKILKTNIIDILKETKKINAKYMIINAGIWATASAGLVWQITSYAMSFAKIKALFGINSNKNKE